MPFHLNAHSILLALHAWSITRPFIYSRFVSVPRISSKLLKPRWRYGDFSIFQGGGRPQSWICDACVRTTNEGHLAVSLSLCKILLESMQYSFDNMHVFRFHEFGLKTLIHAPKLGFWVFLTSYIGAMWTNPKRHILVLVRIVWVIMRQNPSTGLTCRWVPQKGHK